MGDYLLNYGASSLPTEHLRAFADCAEVIPRLELELVICVIEGGAYLRILLD